MYLCTRLMAFSTGIEVLEVPTVDVGKDTSRGLEEDPCVVVNAPLDPFVWSEVGDAFDSVGLICGAVLQTLLLIVFIGNYLFAFLGLIFVRMKRSCMDQVLKKTLHSASR